MHLTSRRLVVNGQSDDLNSLYVYEAKMSLLTRIAQTRSGAERLIEARVLPTLAVCDFLDTRPDVDQTFIGERLLKFRWLILIEALVRSGSFPALRHSAVSPVIPAHFTTH